jgi:hypothetical protein
VSNLFLLRGISATGKGTRVSTLLEFLKTKTSYRVEEVTSIIVDDVELQKTPIQLSVVFDDINTVFIGRWVKSNKSKLISWTSLDGYSKYNNDTFYNHIMRSYNTRNVVCEGYFGGKGKTFDPPQIAEIFKSADLEHYYYESMDELQSRVMGRSGSTIKGTCYRDNKWCIKEKNRQRVIDLFTAAVPNSTYNFIRHHEEVHEFGSRFLNKIGKSEWVSEFISFASENSTKRNVESIEENYSKFSKYLGFDSENRTNLEIKLNDYRKRDISVD